MKYEEFVILSKATAGTLIVTIEPHAIVWCVIGFAIASLMNMSLKKYVQRHE